MDYKSINQPKKHQSNTRNSFALTGVLVAGLCIGCTNPSRYIPRTNEAGTSSPHITEQINQTPSSGPNTPRSEANSPLPADGLLLSSDIASMTVRRPNLRGRGQVCYLMDYVSERRLVEVGTRLTNFLGVPQEMMTDLLVSRIDERGIEIDGITPSWNYGLMYRGFRSEGSQEEVEENRSAPVVRMTAPFDGEKAYISFIHTESQRHVGFDMLNSLIRQLSNRDVVVMSWLAHLGPCEDGVNRFTAIVRGNQTIAFIMHIEQNAHSRPQEFSNAIRLSAEHGNVAGTARLNIVYPVILNGQSHPQPCEDQQRGQPPHPERRAPSRRTPQPLLIPPERGLPIHMA